MTKDGSDTDKPVHPHKQALKETGFWGRSAAGGLVFAKSTKRFLLAHRGEDTLQPGTWATWGGACDENETPAETVQRELREETGLEGLIISTNMTPLFVFRHSSGFSYSNFLVTVEDEFQPTLNWETQGYGWFRHGDWPTPLHFGVEQLFADLETQNKLRAITAG